MVCNITPTPKHCIQNINIIAKSNNSSLLSKSKIIAGEIQKFNTLISY